jgi:hypothetical protein
MTTDRQYNYERIAGIDGLDHFHAYAAEVEIKKNSMMDSAITGPEICDSDITRDIRYKLGFAAGLAWALSLPEQCRTEINMIRQRGNNQ